MRLLKHKLKNILSQKGSCFIIDISVLPEVIDIETFIQQYLKFQSYGLMPLEYSRVQEIKYSKFSAKEIKTYKMKRRCLTQQK